MILMPVGLSRKINPSVAGIHHKLLLDQGCAVTVNKAEFHAQRPILRAADFACRDILEFLTIENINVPGVIIHGLIFVNAQHISLAL